MELYIKTIDDPNHDAGQVQIENEIMQLITQLETMLFTSRGEVLNNPGFGASLEDTIYELNANEYQIISEINRQIDQYIPLAEKYNVEVLVDFLEGEVRDIANLNIIIDSQYLVGIRIE